MNHLTKTTKIIGSLMTITFSLMAFAYGQNCSLLAGWSPNTLADGQSRTGYQIENATYTQSCTQAAGRITCTSGSVTNGNTFKYQSCIPQTWRNCTTPTGANHLEYKTLYKASTSTLTESCQQLSQRLQCLDSQFIGGTTPGLYAFASCTDIPRNDCTDIRTNTYKKNGVILVGYTSSTSKNGQTCSVLQKTLTCFNGSWSGGNQSSLFSGCADNVGKSCMDVRTNTGKQHGDIIIGYDILKPSIGKSCSAGQKTLICTDGSRTENGKKFIQNSNIFSGCNGCILPRSGVILSNGSSIPAYSVTGIEFPKSCSNFSAMLSCDGNTLNGNSQTYKYPSCTGLNQLVSGMDIAINESPLYSGYKVAQGSTPQINILFKNKGNQLVSGVIANPGFLSCTRKENGSTIYISNSIESFVVYPGTKMGVNIKINSGFTQDIGKGIQTIICTIDPTIGGYKDENYNNNSRSGSFEIVEADRFDIALSRSIEPISKNLEAAEGAKGVQGVQNFLYNKIMNVLVPLIVIIGILSAILGFYKIMFSSEDTATKEGTNYIIYGVIGIIVIMSAKFIGQNIFDMLTTPDGGVITGSKIAVGLYDKIVYPFIKFAIYLVLGGMFIILVSRVITFLFGTDTDAQKKAGTLIGWNVIAMLIIIGAKQIVEAIYGKQADVARVNGITNLGEIGSGVLADKNIPILYQVINYALGLASLIILVVIIIQTVKLLLKPDDPAQITSIKKSLLYMLMGIFILGAGYLIVNFAIIN